MLLLQCSFQEGNGWLRNKGGRSSEVFFFLKLGWDLGKRFSTGLVQSELMNAPLLVPHHSPTSPWFQASS